MSPASKANSFELGKVAIIAGLDRADFHSHPELK